jgi:hypothetical protein
MVREENVRGLLVSQRNAHVRKIRELAELRVATSSDDIAGVVLDGLLLRLDAELTWLNELEDHTGR